MPRLSKEHCRVIGLLNAKSFRLWGLLGSTSNPEFERSFLLCRYIARQLEAQKRGQLKSSLDYQRSASFLITAPEGASYEFLHTRVTNILLFPENLMDEEEGEVSK